MRALVVSTVHRPDDPRVRERTVGTLASAFDVRFATREPGPSRSGDHEWVRLPGGRARRWLGALRQMLQRDIDVVSLHDPELIPAGLLARLIRQVPVVVDVHEDVPGQILTKEWVPRLLRRPVAWMAQRTLRLAERFCIVTLAEPGYSRLFKDDHPVFANYPNAGALPPVAGDGGYLVYVGDITEQRGALDMIDAASAMPSGRSLRIIGRVSDGLAARMWERAQGLGVGLQLEGQLPHREAMEIVAGASTGLSLLADIPNYRHSLPTKVIEYLAMGVTVVASDLPGTREAVDGLAAVWLVPPGDAGATGAALGEAVVRRGVAEAQVPMMRRRFVWPADDLVALYRRAAGE